MVALAKALDVPLSALARFTGKRFWVVNSASPVLIELLLTQPLNGSPDLRKEDTDDTVLRSQCPRNDRENSEGGWLQLYGGC
jgi:hypothetical protein